MGKLNSVVRTALVSTAAIFGVSFAAPARADITWGISTGLGPSPVCISGTTTTVPATGADCSAAGSATALEPPYLDIGPGSTGAHFDAATGAATFSGAVNFNSNNVQFNTSNVAFGGGSATFNNTVSFTGPSVTFSTGTTFSNASTFNALADFNNGITSNSISNSGTISTNILSSQLVQTPRIEIADALYVSPSANITMGNNIVHSVAAGVADTDAVNVGQLNAATAGISTDVSAIQAVNATQTTQITNLQTGLATTNTNVTTLQSNLASEATTRAAADTALDTRVDALEVIANGLDDRFDDVEDHADAGTATAVALSGAMFLPGKSFNLTGNVGAYRGAVAGALQIGALVSEAVAVNAGVAHGFNKGGKTALRAGFTFGW